MSPSRRADRPWEQVGLAGKSSSLADAAWSPGHIRAQNCWGGKAAVWGSWKCESGGWPFRFSFNRFAAIFLHFLRTDFYKHLCQCSPFWMLQMNPFIPSSLEPGLCGKWLLDSGWVSKHFTQKCTVRGRAGRRKGEMCHVQVEGNGGHRKDCDSDPVFWDLETHTAPGQTPWERKEPFHSWEMLKCCPGAKERVTKGACWGRP